MTSARERIPTQLCTLELRAQISIEMASFTHSGHTISMSTISQSMEASSGSMIERLPGELCDLYNLQTRSPALYIVLSAPHAAKATRFSVIFYDYIDDYNTSLSGTVLWESTSKRSE